MLGDDVVDESSSCVFLTRFSDHATGSGFSLMSCFPWHTGNDNNEIDDLFLDWLSSVCSCAIDKLSLAGGFLLNKSNDVEDDDEVSSHKGRCNCLPQVGGGFGDA